MVDTVPSRPLRILLEKFSDCESAGAVGYKCYARDPRCSKCLAAEEWLMDARYLC